MFVESELIFIGSTLDVRPREVGVYPAGCVSGSRRKDVERDACEIMILEMMVTRGKSRNGVNTRYIVLKVRV